MRLNAGLLSFLVVAAVALVAAVVLASTAPAQPATCDAADTSMDRQIVAQARSGYTAILKAEPTSECAAKGMQRVIRAMCQRADTLRTGKAKPEARAAYRAILALDPPDWDPKHAPGWNVGCAIRGLNAVGPDPTTP